MLIQSTQKPRPFLSKKKVWPGLSLCRLLTPTYKDMFRRPVRRGTLNTPLRQIMHKNILSVNQTLFYKLPKNGRPALFSWKSYSRKPFSQKVKHMFLSVKLLLQSNIKATFSLLTKHAFMGILDFDLLQQNIKFVTWYEWVKCSFKKTNITQETVNWVLPWKLWL